MKKPPWPWHLHVFINKEELSQSRTLHKPGKWICHGRSVEIPQWQIMVHKFKTSMWIFKCGLYDRFYLESAGCHSGCSRWSPDAFPCIDSIGQGRGLDPLQWDCSVLIQKWTWKLKVFAFYGQTSAKGAKRISEGIAKSTCEDSYRIGVDVVHGGRGQIILKISSSPISCDSLKSLFPEVRYKSPLSLLLQVLLALTPFEIIRLFLCFPFIHVLGYFWITCLVEISIQSLNHCAIHARITLMVSQSNAASKPRCITSFYLEG